MSQLPFTTYLHASGPSAPQAIPRYPPSRGVTRRVVYRSCRSLHNYTHRGHAPLTAEPRDHEACAHAYARPIDQLNGDPTQSFRKKYPNAMSLPILKMFRMVPRSWSPVPGDSVSIGNYENLDARSISAPARCRRWISCLRRMPPGKTSVNKRTQTKAKS